MKYQKHKRFEQMTTLQKWEDRLEELKQLEREGRNVSGLIATYQDKVQIYKKAMMLL